MMLGYPYGWITAVGLFFLLILVVGLTSQVELIGHLRRIDNNDDFELNIKALFGILRYRIKVPMIQFTGTSIQLKEQVSKKNVSVDTWKQFNEDIDAEKIVNMIERTKHLLHMTKNLTGWVRKSLTKVRLLEWNWSTSVGTGDAMWTAMTTGLVWSIKTSIIGVLSQMVKLKTEPKMNVQPNYQQAAFTTEWSCKAQIRFGYAVLAGMKLMVRMRKLNGGLKAWEKLLFKP